MEAHRDSSASLSSSKASVLEKSDPVSMDVNSLVTFKTEVKMEEAILAEINPDDAPEKSLLRSPDLLSRRGDFGCGVCGETFVSLSQLAKHMQFHDHIRPFLCSICGKRFLSRSHHTEHQRVHTGERPFPCNRCERSFTTHHNLKRHQLIHDKEEMYSCAVCGVVFCQEHQLGNIRGIITVLKQHNVEELISPEVFLGVRAMPEPECEVDSSRNFELKAIVKEEQTARKVKRKHKHLDLDEDHSTLTVSKVNRGEPLFHSDVPLIHESKQPNFSNAVYATGTKIQKIAYDIEIIV